MEVPQTLERLRLGKDQMPNTCSLMRLKRCVLLSSYLFTTANWAFAQLLRPEVERHAPWWAWTGAVCGAGLGFIVGNVPGLMVGAYAGNRLGAIRDAKGKSVAAVFAQLGGDQKAQVRPPMAWVRSCLIYSRIALGIDTTSTCRKGSRIGLVIQRTLSMIQ